LGTEQVGPHFIVNETLFTVPGQLPVLSLISLLKKQDCHANPP
jgi:hypothetical protein